MSAVQLVRLFPNDLGVVPSEWIIDMEHYRDAKIQLQTTSAEVQYVLESSLVDLLNPIPWPVVLAQGQLAEGSTMLIHVNTHYPKLRLTLQGDVETMQVWACLSDPMQN